MGLGGHKMLLDKRGSTVIHNNNQSPLITKSACCVGLGV